MDAVAGQVAAGVWPKTVQELSSACDRATRSCALRELRNERTRVMENPSASCTAGLRDSAARSGIGVDRAEAVQDLTSSATRALTLRADRGSGWPGEGDAESFRIDRDTGLDRADRESGWPDCGDAGFFRIERGRAAVRDWARVQLAPLPQGVGSLLGRAGEARSGFCREVKRRDARSSMSGSLRRLTSRQVPDCLRGPAEERAHPRNLTIPNPSPPRRRQHPREPGTLSEGRARAGGEILKPQAAPPTQRVGGWSDEPGDAKRPPKPRRPPRPDKTPHPTNTQPIINSR